MCDLVVGEEGDPQLGAVTPGQDRTVTIGYEELTPPRLLGVQGEVSPDPAGKPAKEGGRREKGQNLSFQFTHTLLRSSLQ